jgi:hypothetical protein
MEPAIDRQRFEWVTRAIRHLSENPDVHDRLTDAFRRNDTKMFAKVLTEHWRKYGIEPPPDKCDPYTTVYVFVAWPTLGVRRCQWTAKAYPSLSPRTPIPPPTPRTPTPPTPTPPPLPSPLPPEPPQTDEALLQQWIAHGFVVCKWVVHEAEFRTIKKFVEGVCPPGTF